MNELHFAHKVRQHLNLGLHDLPSATIERLEAARQNALARQKITVHQSLLVAAGCFIQHRLGDFRVKQTVAAFALLVAVVFSTFWMADQHVTELEAIDSALLADDLPIGAFTDKGFDAWLKRTSSES